MGIHQALIGGYSLFLEWELVQSHIFASSFGRTIDPSVTFSNAQVGDILVVATDDDSSGSFGTAFAGVQTNETSLLFHQLSNWNSAYFGDRHTPASGWAQIKTPLVSGQELLFDGSEGVIALFRPPLADPVFLAKRQQFESESNVSAPSHQNTSIPMKENSLAVLIGMLANDNNTPFSAPGNAVLVDDVYDTNSVMMGYQKITSDGNYSWGQWGTSGLSTDDTGSYIAEAFNTDWEVVSNTVGYGVSTNDTTISGLQENDLVLFIGGADNSATRSISQSAGLTISELKNDFSNSVAVFIASTVIPSSLSSFSFNYTGVDRHNTLVIRKKDATSSFTLTSKKELSSSFSRFPVGTVSNLNADNCVILCCFVDDDGADTHRPFQGPVGASLVSQSNRNLRGSNLISYDATKVTGSRTYGDFNGKGLGDAYRIIVFEIENS